MAECVVCGQEARYISEFLGLCRDCIIHDFKNVKPRIDKAHQISREAFGLPLSPPKVKRGIQCSYCFNRCNLGIGMRGYCGVRENRDGRKIIPLEEQGYFSWYYDPLPTNCVADWVCPGGTSSGYPDYSYSRDAEYGYKNLAVFYNGCSFNCLFCQNWQHRKGLGIKNSQSAFDLSQAADEKTSCICFFGGDPSPQILHSISSSRIARVQRKQKILRICWETNGTMNSRFLENVLGLALESGGCVKFDLKAFNPQINKALCGRNNKQTKRNFELAVKWTEKRKEPPLVVASTLLVPGYVEKDEVYQIAKFIASLDPEVPYSLLGFYPHFYFKDLPLTSRRHAEECQEQAFAAGLKRVRIGNIHLLGKDY